jgi:hypothetical protein
MITDADRLRQIRQKVDALAKAEWQLGYFGEKRFVTTDGGVFGSGGEILSALDACSDEEFEFAAAAPSMVRFLLGLVDRARMKIREVEAAASEAPAKNYAAQAALKAREEPFQRFLASIPELSRVPVPDDPVEAADRRLKLMVGVKSKRELNQDERAAHRWRGLQRDYAFWVRHGAGAAATDRQEMDGYDAAKDGRDSYSAAIDAKRQRGDRHWPGESR